MSQITCSSCGSANSAELVYCSSCGAILGKSADSPASSASSPAASVARRRHQRIEADRPEPPSFLARLGGLLRYLLSVGIGVIVVLAIMTPKGVPPLEPPLEGARGVLDQLFAASRFASSGLSQQVADSLLAQQGPVTFDSPVRMVPMPVWETTRVEFTPGTVILRSKLRFLGLGFSLSETFRLQGGPGSWTLVPVAGTIGMLDLGDYLLPSLSVVIRPPVTPFAKDLEALSKARSLVIRYGIVEFTSR